MALTTTQQNILNAVRAEGVKVYNGKSRKAIEVLESQGLVVVEYDEWPHGGQRIVVHRTDSSSSGSRT